MGHSFHREEIMRKPRRGGDYHGKNNSNAEWTSKCEINTL
jgi:hypothetical protein